MLTQDIESPAGAGRYFPLAKELVKLGHQVSIIGLHPNFPALNERHFVKEGVEILYVAPMHVRKVGNRKLYYPTWQILPLIIKSTLALTRAALRIPADLIHIGKPHPMNTLAGLLIRRLRGLPLVVDCDDYEAKNNRFMNIFDRKIVSSFEKIAVFSADHVTVHTHLLLDLLIREGVPAHRLTYLPHGVDRARFSISDNLDIFQFKENIGLKDKKIVVYIGSFSRITHALDHLLKAFIMVREERYDAALLLLGRGEDYEWLQVEIQRLGLTDSVCLYGWVPPEYVPIFYRVADVSVDPVYNNEAGRYSLSLKLLESMAAGVPVVTVDVGDRRRIIGVPPAGILVPPDSPYLLASAILTVLNNPFYAAILRERARMRIEEFYWDRLVVLVEKLYKNLCR